MDTTQEVSKHSPGPWRKVWMPEYHGRPPFYEIQHGNDGEVVCQTDADFPTQYHDACIIEAAPELLAKVKQQQWAIGWLMASLINADPGFRPTKSPIWSAVEDTAELVAKAEGGAA